MLEDSSQDWAQWRIRAGWSERLWRDKTRYFHLNIRRLASPQFEVLVTKRGDEAITHWFIHYWCGILVESDAEMKITYGTTHYVSPLEDLKHAHVS